MPQIIVQAHALDDRIGAITLAKLPFQGKQQHDHRVAQLIERVGLALVDAQQLEMQPTTRWAGSGRVDIRRVVASEASK